MTNLSKTKRPPVTMDLQNSILLIQDIERKSQVSKIIRNGTTEIIDATWEKGNRQFILEINNPDRSYISLPNIREDYSLHLGSHLLKFKQLFISGWSGHKAMGVISSIHSDNFSHTTECYNRLFIPLSLSFRLDFTFAITASPINYSIGDYVSCTLGIKAILARNNFKMYVAENHSSDQKNKYLVIECEGKISENAFHEYCYSILLSFGYLTGKLILNEGYFIQYDDTNMTNPIHFAYTRLRSSISFTYVPVDTNPMSWLNKRELHDLYKNKVRSITTEEFSELSKLVYSNDDYKGLLLLILESANTSLVSSPAILSVALESIARIFKDENHKAFSVVNKAVFRRILSKLNDVVNEFQSEIGKQEAKYLETKLSQLNQVTNRDKLLIPFNLMNITLNEKDKYAINQRNAFLHGRHPFTEEVTNYSPDNSEGLRYFIFLKLYTLISAIILKKIGFDNLIVNYPKIYENETNIKLDEDYYRQI